MKEKTSGYCSIMIVSFFLITACASSKNVNDNYLYFKNGSDTVSSQQRETVIQQNDLLSIQVYSRTLNQEQTAIFNIPPNNGVVQGYQVSGAGTIQIPVIGSIKVAGLNKDELKTLLEQKLIDYVKNPSVLVRFLQFNVNVLGEVRSPGLQRFTVDHVTIIDALSAAGDMTDFGKREDVTVIREENGRRIYYSIDLRRKNIFASPVYTLQPNDIVYVGPNKNKIKGLSVDPEVQRKTGLVLSILSVVVSLTTLVVTVLR